MNSANKWMPKWESNGWKTSSGAPVANRGELERFADAKKGMDVTVVRIFVFCIA
jgi:ribonuclease HI